MTEKNNYYQELLKLLLPTEIFEYFEIVNLELEDKKVHVYLDEHNIIPAEYKQDKLTSKGFHNVAIIQDFPIRAKAVFLHIRRRRWVVKTTNKIVSREWDAVAKGTRYTKSFAIFLNKLLGHISNQ